MPNLYRCRFSNAEVFSDAFPTDEKSFGGYIWTVESEVMKKEAMKFDIGDCEEVEDADKDVNNLVEATNLQPANFNKKDFMLWVKGYMGKIIEEIKKKEGTTDETIVDFKKQATAVIKKVTDNWDNCDCYVNEENDYEGAVAIGLWTDRKKDKGPVFFFFRDGYTREKI